MSEKITDSPFQFCNKPAGVPTHRPSEERLGYLEWLSYQQKRPLWSCHRLDKETSGTLLIANDKVTAGELSQLFAEQKVHKIYIFISDQKSTETEWVIEDADSRTDFRWLRSEHGFSLYEAKPHTGRTHQIRKHAQQSRVSILGDMLYGGRAFPRLLLHSLSLSFRWRGQEYQYSSPMPRLFDDLSLCLNSQLAQWTQGFERRETLFPELMSSEAQSLRCLHNDGGDLRVDKVGSQWLLGWWSDLKPSKQAEVHIQQLMDLWKIQKWRLIWHPGVEHPDSDKVLLQGSGFDETDWSFQELGIQYKASLRRGKNFGLFLDQRERRRWVMEQASEKSLLNLFAFTCGFSVAAALGGAKKVVSVDLFPAYIDWGKENFTLNGLDSSSEQYEFWSMDSFEYLKIAQKKMWTFDCIICDPPSFSRHKKMKSIFRVEKDYVQLLKLCSDQLKPGGRLIFSTNYEKWNYSKWRREIVRSLEGMSLQLLPNDEITHWDYEWSGEEAVLKSFVFEKRNDPKA